jgi:hypothetical protein
VQAPGRVDDHDVAALRGRGLDAVAGDRDGIAARAAVEDRHVDLAPERLELLDGRRALQVAGHERGLHALLDEQVRELARGGRLARALQAAEQDHGRRLGRERELGAGRAEQLRELLVDDLHDLLAGRQAPEHLLADRALAHCADERLDDAEVDVGLEQGEADLAHRAIDVLLAERAARAEVAEGGLQFVGKRLEHAGRMVAARGR